MLTLLYGPDSFSRHEELVALRQRLDRDSMLSTNTTTLEARGLTPAELMLVCDALPFLGEWRLVHVRGLLARAGSERSGRRRSRGATVTRAAATDGGWLELAEYVERMPPTTVLVLEDGAVSESNPLLSALKELRLEPPATIRGFSQLDPRALRTWVSERIRRRGAVFAPEAVDLLVQSMPREVGEDGQWHVLWSLHADIEKLCLYRSGAPVTEQDVGRLVPAALESRQWVLSDRVLDGNRRAALTVLEELLAAGRPAPVLLATLANRFRQVLITRDLTERRASVADIRDQTGARADWALQQLQRLAQRKPLRQLERAYLRIVEADRDIKSGRMDEQTALEVLVADLTQPA